MNEEVDVQNNDLVNEGLDIQAIESPRPLTSDQVISVAPDAVIPVYSTVDDEQGMPVAYDILLGADDEQAEEETQELTEFTDNDILLQLNENIVDGIGVVSSLFGLIMGIVVGFEVLKIWLA